MLEPSDSWKQNHSFVPEHHERRRSYDGRVPEGLFRERERTPERVLPMREHYSPVLVPNDRYRNTSHGPDIRDAHPYGPRTDSYRLRHSNSPPLPASPYHPGDGYGSAWDVPIRESPRPTQWEQRVVHPTRHEYNYDNNTNPGKFQLRREHSASPGFMRDEVGPTTYGSRSSLQEYAREAVGSTPSTWNPRSESPGLLASRTPRSRFSVNSYPAPSRIRSRSRSSSGSSRKAAVLGRTTTHSGPDTVDGRHLTSSEIASKQHHLNTRQEVALPPKRMSVEGLSASHPSPPPERRGSDLEKIADYEWSDPPSKTVHPNRHEQIDNLPVQGADVRAALDTRAAVATSDTAIPSPVQVSAHATPKGEGDRLPSPTVRAEETPEPDIPLSLQTSLSNSTSIPSALPTRDGHEPEPDERPAISTPDKPSVPDIEPMPMYEALRVIVMVRLQQQDTSRAESVENVLMTNLSKAEPITPSVATPTALVREITGGERLHARASAFKSTESSLKLRFAQRQVDITRKIEQLRAEYTALNTQWVAHCAKLDEVAKNLALQEAAATAGRTTRRSLATMGDAVRSDLEMEQIIASLGNEELTDATHLGARNAAVIPDMISVEANSVDYTFDDTNNEVLNPAQYYAPKTGIDDWTEEEVSIFVEKFAEFPKQFGVISDFLPYKTPAQCVTFYYLHKNKHIDFRKVVARRAIKRKRGSRKQKSNALLADIRQKDDEATVPPRRRRTVLLPLPEPRRPSARRSALQSEHTPTATPTPEPEPDRKRRKRASARVAFPNEEENNNEDQDAEPKPAKRARRARKPKQLSPTPLSTPSITEDIPPFAGAGFDDGRGVSSTENAVASAVWSDSDKALLSHLLSQFGEDYDRIAASMPNKTAAQVARFYRSMNGSSLPARIVPSLSSGVTIPSASNGPPTWGTSPFDFSSQAVPSFTEHNPTYGAYRPSSRETSGSSTPIVPISATPFSNRQSPLEPIHTPYGAPRSYVPILPRDALEAPYPSVPHPPSYTSNTGRSRLAIISSAEHIANPSPFTNPLAFAPRTYSNLSRYDNEVTHLTEPKLGEGVTDDRRPVDVGTSSASMAFDALPAFVPPPQTWPHAPLQTTDDLVAYLEHRTRLAQQQ
ncbi:hypothetical protein BDW22DRAFT_790240 [Trametopsis cervina]|nr:hypothetical protein BDW22DRAFT_790240 [Trametopsis cervina]